MGLLVWIIVGAIGGWLASLVMGSRMSLLSDIIIGIIGGLLGGFLFSLFGGGGISGINLWSILVSFVGAVILLWIVNAIRGPARVTAP